MARKRAAVGHAHLPHDDGLALGRQLAEVHAVGQRHHRGDLGAVGVAGILALVAQRRRREAHHHMRVRLAVELRRDAPGALDLPVGAVAVYDDHHFVALLDQQAQVFAQHHREYVLAEVVGRHRVQRKVHAQYVLIGVCKAHVGQILRLTLALGADVERGQHHAAHLSGAALGGLVGGQRVGAKGRGGAVPLQRAGRKVGDGAALLFRHDLIGTHQLQLNLTHNGVPPVGFLCMYRITRF